MVSLSVVLRRSGPIGHGSFGLLVIFEGCSTGPLKAALLRWRHFLKPGGTIAFDTPAKPFGFSQRASDAALRNGVKLSYGDLADTSEKCRELLAQADLEVVSIRKAFASTTPIKLDHVIAIYDERIDHPAWQSIKNASPKVRKAIRDDFIKSATTDAVDGFVPDDVALFFSTGTRSQIQH